MRLNVAVAQWQASVATYVPYKHIDSASDTEMDRIIWTKFAFHFIHGPPRTHMHVAHAQRSTCTQRTQTRAGHRHSVCLRLAAKRSLILAGIAMDHTVGVARIRAAHNIHTAFPPHLHRDKRTHTTAPTHTIVRKSNVQRVFCSARCFGACDLSAFHLAASR